MPHLLSASIFRAQAVPPVTADTHSRRHDAGNAVDARRARAEPRGGRTAARRARRAARRSRAAPRAFVVHAALDLYVSHAPSPNAAVSEPMRRPCNLLAARLNAKGAECRGRAVTAVQLFKGFASTTAAHRALHPHDDLHRLRGGQACRLTRSCSLLLGCMPRAHAPLLRKVPARARTAASRPLGRAQLLRALVVVPAVRPAA